MARSKVKSVIVVGGGLAGLSAALKLAEKGCHVKLFSVTPVRRSHSVCAQGGINAGMNLMGEDDSPLIHAYDTIKGGDFLADQPPVLEMCYAAPAIINMLDRFGCPFNRTAEGNLDFRRFGGTLYHRTAFCGASTGQQLLYALDEQVRRHEAAGDVEKFEQHEFLRLILDEEGRARGIVIMNMFNLKLESFLGDAVVIATGGPGLIFKKSTNSTFCTGAANGRLYLQGMHYANGEFIQIHPTAIPGEDKLRLMSESLRGEGGRIWVNGNDSKQIQNNEGKWIPCGKTGEPWYFLEELYPIFGNLVPRDIAAREILRICELGLGVDGGSQVYLDITKLSHEKQQKLASVMDIYEKFTGDDPRHVPMKIFPAVHYSMGGGWVDYPSHEDSNRDQRYRHMTNIPGCFNCGESDFLYHGANRLGANSLLSCIFGGLVTGCEIPLYLKGSSLKELSQANVRYAVTEEEKWKHELFSRDGNENVHMLHNELSDILVAEATVKRSNQGFIKATEAIRSIQERYKHIRLSDHSPFANQTYFFASQFKAMLELAKVITEGALQRNESRGSHYKPEFPERDDDKWLCTTIATYDKDKHGPRFSHLPIDRRYFEPTLRDYTKIKKQVPEVLNLPKAFPLPF